LYQNGEGIPAYPLEGGNNYHVKILHKDTMSNICPSCGKELVTGSKNCMYCGAKIEQKKNVTSNVCPTCGKTQVTGSTECMYCGASLIMSKEEYETHQMDYSKFSDTKENRVILAKIATKRAEIDRKSFTGPLILGVIGLFTVLIIIGILLILIAWVWYNSITQEVAKLKNEIKELEAELE
jgi:uncharacterized membrane protein YvbJ